MEEYRKLIELVTDKTIFIGIDRETFLECENDEDSEEQTSSPCGKEHKILTVSGEKTIYEIRGGMVIVLNDKGMLDALIYIYEMYSFMIWKEKNILVVYGHENVVLLDLGTNEFKKINTR